MEREEIRFGCIERATALVVRWGKGDVKVSAELFFEFVGADPLKLRALDAALTRPDFRGTASRYVEFAAGIIEFVNLADETNRGA